MGYDTKYVFIMNTELKLLLTLSWMSGFVFVLLLTLWVLTL